MDRSLRDAQLKLLETFGKAAKTFALAGGTALELFYLKHRFSRDLDFFSPVYNVKEIDNIIDKFGETMGAPVKYENEFASSSHAKVRFYSVKPKGISDPLKIDFVEDVLFDKPTIRKFSNIPVYDIKNIYFQKIMTLTGANLSKDETGREITAGRKEARDIFDIYCLSKKIEPLHKYLKNIDNKYQRGIIHWYRSYSRQETKIGMLDLEIYDSEFDVSEMIRYLDSEINKFMAEVIK